MIYNQGSVSVLCPNCRATIEEGYKFCAKCGNRISTEYKTFLKQYVKFFDYLKKSFNDDMIKEYDAQRNAVYKKMKSELDDISCQIEDAFSDLGVDIELVQSYIDGSFLCFSVHPNKGVRISKITRNLLDVSISIGINKLTYELKTEKSVIILKCQSKFSQDIPRENVLPFIQSPDFSENIIKAIDFSVANEVFSSIALQRHLIIGSENIKIIIAILEQMRVIKKQHDSELYTAIVSAKEWIAVKNTVKI